MTLSSLFGDADLGSSPATPTVGHTGHTQSLYRKYRPQSFDADELVGQEHIVRTLRNAIQLNRVAHAYLFCGPRGTGKTTTARLLAKAVNCLDPDVMNRPCNRCANCLAITANATADVIEIDAASNRGIDDIRDLRERVKYAPSQLKTKIYIIDEAHQITGAAANAFLKTLEEPPAHSIFVLATTDPEELLQTIVSRCQRFDFHRIPIRAMIGRLRTVANAEDLVVDDDALAAIARHGAGSLRDGISLLDQLSVFTEATESEPARIDLPAVLALLGVSRNERIELMVEAIADKNPGAALGVVNEAIEAGEDARQLNRQLVAYLRVLLHERAGGSPDADDRAKQLAARFELGELVHLARIFSETDFKIRHSVYPQLPLEIALVESIAGPGQPAARPVASTAPTQSTQTRPTAPAPSSSSRSAEEEHLLSAPPVTSLKDRLRGATPQPAMTERRPQSAPVEPSVSAPALPPEPSPRPASQPGELTVDYLAEIWTRVRADVKAVNRRAEALLSNVDPIDVKGTAITLGSTYEFHGKKLNEDDNRRLIEDAIQRIIGKTVTVTTVARDGYVAASAPAPVVSAPVVARDDERERLEAERDEQRIQAAKNIFDGEVVS
jgi:DNA polymerase-3 subunit gamma/tau